MVDPLSSFFSFLPLSSLPGSPLSLASMQYSIILAWLPLYIWDLSLSPSFSPMYRLSAQVVCR